MVILVDEQLPGVRVVERPQDVGPADDVHVLAECAIRVQALDDARRG
jgi:hypothetical protein